MKLTVNNNRIYMPSDAKISIEKNSPVLNDDTGTFSYPFPVPTLPNQKNLGWPGRLQRVGNIPDRSFVLEDQGVQVLKGEVDYTDGVTRDEVGVVLKSGMTEFYTVMKDVMLSDIDLGSEYLWSSTPAWSAIDAKLAAWDVYNATANNPIVAAPCMMNGVTGDIAFESQYESAYINNHDPETGYLTIKKIIIPPRYFWAGYFMLQFKVWWLIEKIFNTHGYEIVVNDVKDTGYNKAILFTRPFYVSAVGLSGGATRANPYGDLEYSSLMPSVSVLDFLDAVKSMFCLALDIDERRREVRLYFRKTIFEASSLDKRKLVEMAGWEHDEVNAMDGFSFRYQSQDDKLATEEDYEIDAVVTELPTPTEESETCRISESGHDYIAEYDEEETLVWVRIGRLKGVTTGNGEDTTEINVNVPEQESFKSIEGAKMDGINRLMDLSGGRFVDVSSLYISLYHGLRYMGDYAFPYTCGENYSKNKWFSVVQQTYLYHYTTPSLTPAALYADVYEDWLNWHYQARAWKKYFRMSLQEVINLQWNKRYVVNGIPIILDKIKFDLPYNGIIEVDGYTA